MRPRKRTRQNVDCPSAEFQKTRFRVPAEVGRHELAHQPSFPQHGCTAKIPQRNGLINEARLLELHYPVRQQRHCRQYQDLPRDLDEGTGVYPLATGVDYVSKTMAAAIPAAAIVLVCLGHPDTYIMAKFAERPTYEVGRNASSVDNEGRQDELKRINACLYTL